VIIADMALVLKKVVFLKAHRRKLGATRSDMGTAGRSKIEREAIVAYLGIIDLCPCQFQSNARSNPNGAPYNGGITKL